MSDVKIIFSVGGKIIGTMESSLEGFDASPHLIPKRILNRICNTNNSVEISFSINYGEFPESVNMLDRIKLITWMYENGYFSLKSADMLTKEIEKGTFNYEIGGNKE